MVQSAFGGFQYFKGSPVDAIRSIVSAVQPGGTVVMPAFPFDCTSFEYLERKPTFDVNKSPARTGLLCEIFRRQFAPIRSLHPTHSVMALGPRAEDIVSDHHRSWTPFDKYSPWHRLYELDAWDVNVGLALRCLAITHCHYFEERLESKLDLPLYWPETFEAKVRDVERRECTVQAYAHHPASREARNYPRLSQRFLDAGVLRHVRAGAIDIWAGRVRALFEVVKELVAQGIPAFHETEGHRGNTPETLLDRSSK